MNLEGYETKLFGPYGDPVLVSKAGLYFSPWSFENVGRFSPFINTTTLPTEKSVSQYDRKMLVALSQDLFANMSDVNAAINILSDLVVGAGMNPIYNGSNDPWADATTNWVTEYFYNNCSWNGFAFDWKACWKLAIKKIIIDGDILLVFGKDRYGFPKLDFIESYRIANRPGQTEIISGRYNGYPVRDGVVYNAANTPIGYQVVGETEDEDYVIATPSNSLLLFNPFSFEKGRGLPALASAIKDGRMLRDIDAELQQMIKVESAVYLVEKNDTGRPAAGRTINPFASTNVTSPPINGASPMGELWFGGVKYTKPEGDVKSLNSNRPATQTVDFLTRMEKRMLMTLPFPHQFLLTPENIGGASSRGVKELLVRGIQSKQSLIERPALVALRYAIASAMTIGVIPENYKEDFTNWGFTKAAEIVLDASYERASDLADYFAGVKSIDEIVSKSGKRYKDVLKQRVKDFRLAVDALKEAEQLEPEYKELAKAYIVGKDIELPPTPVEQPQQTQQKK